MINTLNLDLDWEINVKHRFKGQFLGQHVVSLQIGQPNKKIHAVLNAKNARKLAVELLKFLPDDHDYNPDKFRESLIGRSFKEIWEDEGHSILQNIAHQHGLTWEELHECREDSELVEHARKGEDECCLWLIHDNDKITDVVWG
ncbi:hypothetical protein LCGC14_0834540 [marine sediment metagenome]|uniref:Uncharacterized protein n=1 Tax=marine sediment metagenome TaxID=412755 RepID=A0A0F9RZN8_9ZZZZ